MWLIPFADIPYVKDLKLRKEGWPYCSSAVRIVNHCAATADIKMIRCLQVYFAQQSLLKVQPLYLDGETHPIPQAL